MRTRRYFASLLALTLGLAGLSFIGIHYDPEFEEPIQIVKKHPSLRLKSDSPIGESDLQLNDLPLAYQQDELAFRTIESGENVNDALTAIQPIPSQLIISLIALGTVGILRQPRVSSAKCYLSYFSIGLIMLVVLEFINQGFTTYLLHNPTAYFITLFVINLLLFVWLTRHKKEVTSTWTTSTTPS